jgi:tetratricopeptide (TPR) repeat protein
MDHTQKLHIAAQEALKSGDRPRAARLYEQLSMQPNAPLAALIEAAGVLMGAKEPLKAVAIATAGVDRFRQPGPWRTLLQRWQQEQQMEAVEILQRHLLARFGAMAELHHDRARFLLARNRPQEAFMCAQEALALSPGAQSWGLLGRVEQQLGRLDRAYRAALEALRLEPRHPQRAIAVMEILLQQQRTVLALRSFAQLRRRVSAPEELWLWLANRHYNRGNYQQAKRYYHRALKANDRFVPALSNLGVLHKERGENDAAKACYQKALAIRPEDPAANNNYGVLLKQQKAYDEAERCFKKALAANPYHADALSNLGALAKVQFEDAKAIAFYQRALSIRPDHVNAHVDLSMILLAHGQYAAGWAHYEWRLRMRELSGKLAPWRDSPLWRGEDLTGKSIAIQTEQGYGDSLQFVRFVQGLKERGAAKIGIRTRAALVRLFEQMPQVDWVVDEASPPPAHDLFVPMMSLAGRLGITPQTLPYATGYLPVPKGPAPFKLTGKRLKVGLCYAGSPTFREAAAKRVAIEAFGFLADEAVEVINLQVDEQREAFSHLKLPHNIDKSDKLKDFADTAQVVSRLDLIITIDTAMAHLAGGLNRPVWVLISRQGSDWRWGLKGENTPWYPSARLFRQRESESWQAPLEEMAEAFKAWVKARKDSQ